MQEVTLKGPRVINGAVRYPIEGQIPVSDDEYDRLIDAKAIVVDEDSDENALTDITDDLDGEKIADLKTIAEKDGVDLGTVTRKDDIVAAIRAHRALHPAA